MCSHVTFSRIRTVELFLSSTRKTGTSSWRRNLQVANPEPEQLIAREDPAATTTWLSLGVSTRQWNLGQKRSKAVEKTQTGRGQVRGQATQCRGQGSKFQITETTKAIQPLVCVCVCRVWIDLFQLAPFLGLHNKLLFSPPLLFTSFPSHFAHHLLH